MSLPQSSKGQFDVMIVERVSKGFDVVRTPDFRPALEQPEIGAIDRWVNGLQLEVVLDDGIYVQLSVSRSVEGRC